MSAAIETVQEFMAAFVAAWPNQDAARVASFFSPDGVYHNIPMDPVKGRQAIETTVAGFMAIGGKVSVDVAHILADGPIVMVERVDYFTRDGQNLSLPMVGVFEVHDEHLTAWRDYFDLSQLEAVISDSVGGSDA